MAVPPFLYGCEYWTLIKEKQKWENGDDILGQ